MSASDEGLTTVKPDELYGSIAAALEDLLRSGIPLTPELVHALGTRPESRYAVQQRRIAKLKAEADARRDEAEGHRSLAGRAWGKDQAEAERYADLAAEAEADARRLDDEAALVQSRLEAPEPAPEVLRTSLDAAILAVQVLRHPGPWPPDVLAALHQIVRLEADDDHPLFATWRAYVHLPTDRGPQRFGPITGRVPNHRQRNRWNGAYECAVADLYFAGGLSLSSIGEEINRRPPTVEKYIRDALQSVVPTEAGVQAAITAPLNIGRRIWKVVQSEGPVGAFDGHLIATYRDADLQWGHAWRIGRHDFRAEALRWIVLAGEEASARGLRAALGMDAFAYRALVEGDDPTKWVAGFGPCIIGELPGRGSKRDSAIAPFRCSCGSPITGLLHVPEIPSGLLCCRCGRSPGLSEDLVFPSAYRVRASHPFWPHGRR
ncbi:MAG: hypothetical protein JWR83_1261 [Aeromicrobium sp.]|nr:hypothetical protein [Aeromicrobium sp.]